MYFAVCTRPAWVNIKLTSNPASLHSTSPRDSSPSTQLAILEKLIDPPFHTSVFFDRYLTVTGVGDILLSLYSRPTPDEIHFQVKLKTASALAKLSSAVERLGVTDQFLMAIGIDKFWQDLPRLFMDDLLP